MTQDDLVSAFLGSFGRGLPGNTYFDDRLEDVLSLLVPRTFPEGGDFF